MSQIKNKTRVRERGEVFTNPKEVKAICDLIPQEIWQNIDSTFLEPSCGNGNFLTEILERKLKYCRNEHDISRAVKSIYAIDIMEDNVKESKSRLIELCSNKIVQYTQNFDIIATVMIECKLILDNQIVCGNALTGLLNTGEKIWFLPQDYYDNLSKKEKDKIIKIYGGCR